MMIMEKYFNKIIHDLGHEVRIREHDPDTVIIMFAGFVLKALLRTIGFDDTLKFLAKVRRLMFEEEKRSMTLLDDASDDEVFEFTRSEIIEHVKIVLDDDPTISRQQMVRLAMWDLFHLYKDSPEKDTRAFEDDCLYWQYVIEQDRKNYYVLSLIEGEGNAKLH